MAAAPASGCGRGCGGDLEWWRILGRDAVVFPEVVAVADTPLDPAMAELVWVDGGAGRPRALPVDGMFCRRFGERLGPLAAADHGGPLIARLGSVIRLRRGVGGQPRYDNDPWWLGRSTRPRPWPASCGCWARRRRRPVRGRCVGGCGARRATDADHQHAGQHPSPGVPAAPPTVKRTFSVRSAYAVGAGAPQAGGTASPGLDTAELSSQDRLATALTTADSQQDHCAGPSCSLTRRLGLGLRPPSGPHGDLPPHHAPRRRRAATQ